MDFPLAAITSHSREEGATLPSSSSSLTFSPTEQSRSASNACQRPDCDLPSNHRPRSISNDTGPSSAREPQGSVNGDDVEISLAASNLPPADRGTQAWMYLVGAFVVETLVWGFPNSFGVFLGYYSQMFREEPGAELLLPLAGTLCSGPILYPIVARYPSHRRTSMWAGNLICFGSLFGASFVNKVWLTRVFDNMKGLTVIQPWQIVLLQGGGYGLGGSLLYAPTVSYMSEWFFARRGLANGVMNAGTAVGGLVLPLILPSIIRPHGTAKTLRYLAITVFVLLSVVLPFIRPRLPEDRIRHLAQGSRTKWTTNKSFWLLLLVTTLQGFAYFLPIVYIPTFAQDMKLNDNQASLAVALLNGSSVISRVSMGLLSDTFNPWVLSTLTLAATSATTFVLWGAVTTTLATLSVYAVLFGALAGGFSSLWTGFIRPIAKDDTTAATSMLGMLMLSRGLGNVLSTPISSALIRGSMRDYVRFGLQNGSRWSGLIIYVGAVFAGATLAGLFGYLRERRPVVARLVQF